MRNKDGLTHKEFLFCEELLRNGFNIRAAYRVAYPNDKGENGFRTLKRKECIEYLNKRRQQKEHTYEKLLDLAHERLTSIILNGDDKDATKAIEILMHTEAKIKELSQKLPEQPQSLNITINSVPNNVNNNPT